jgi:hypothetical protein
VSSNGTEERVPGAALTVCPCRRPQLAKTKGPSSGAYALMFSKPSAWIFREKALLVESSEGQGNLPAARAVASSAVLTVNPCLPGRW